MRRLGAGLFTSPNGRGVLPEDDPLCIGNLSWDPDVRALCREADLLVAIGTRFQGPEHGELEDGAARRASCRSTSSPRSPGRNYPVEAAIVGDAKISTTRFAGRARPDRGAGEDLAEAGWTERVARGRRLRPERGFGPSLGPQAGLLDALAPCLGAGHRRREGLDHPRLHLGQPAPAGAYVPAPRSCRTASPSGSGCRTPLGAARRARSDATRRAPGGRRRLPARGDRAGDRGPGAAPDRRARVRATAATGSCATSRTSQYGRRKVASASTSAGPTSCGLASAFGIRGRASGVSSADFAHGRRAKACRRPRPCLIEVDLDAIGPMAVPYTGTSVRLPESRRPATGAREAQSASRKSRLAHDGVGVHLRLLQMARSSPSSATASE